MPPYPPLAPQSLLNSSLPWRLPSFSSSFSSLSLCFSSVALNNKNFSNIMLYSHHYFDSQSIWSYSSPNCPFNRYVSHNPSSNYFGTSTKIENFECRRMFGVSKGHKTLSSNLIFNNNVNGVQKLYSSFGFGKTNLCNFRRFGKFDEEVMSHCISKTSTHLPQESNEIPTCQYSDSTVLSDTKIPDKGFPGEVFNVPLVNLPIEKLLGCCETQNGTLKVAVLLSGGVDSSVALNLLKAGGHNCVAFYLKIWFQEDFRNSWSECPWEEDLNYAEAVCKQAGVELRVVHLTNEYWNHVVTHCVAEIQAGRTPNPDILCNSRVKFGAFYDHVDFREFDRVASGHYAKVEREREREREGEELKDGRREENVRLALSADQVKDQTYFLSHLSQHQLRRVMFPLGSLSKSEVRRVAESLNLPNRKRRDSQGICFLGKVKFNEFVAQHLGERNGRIMESESGEILGIHKGFWFHTIGQRQGLRLSGGPWYVVAKDVENNVVFVSRNYFSPEKSRRRFLVGNFNWISHTPSDFSTQIKCKVRHGPNFYDCSFQFCDFEGERGMDLGNEDSRKSQESQENAESERMSTENLSAIVTLCEDDQGLAAGQYAAFYEKEICLGSGVILEALGSENLVGENFEVPACEAKEKAAMPWEEEGPKIGKKKKRREERREKERVEEGMEERMEDKMKGMMGQEEKNDFINLEFSELQSCTEIVERDESVKGKIKETLQEIGT